MVCRYASKPFLGNHQKSLYFALAYHDFLHLFIFFHLKVYMIENECFWKGGNLPFFFLFFSLFIFFFFFPNGVWMPLSYIYYFMAILSPQTLIFLSFLCLHYSLFLAILFSPVLLLYLLQIFSLLLHRSQILWLAIPVCSNVPICLSPCLAHFSHLSFSPPHFLFFSLTSVESVLALASDVNSHDPLYILSLSGSSVCVLSQWLHLFQIYFPLF